MTTSHLIRRLKALSSKRERVEAGLFVVEGERAIRQILGSRPDDVVEIIATNEKASGFKERPVRKLSARQFRAIASAKTPQGILAVVRQPPDCYSGRPPKDPGNRILLLEDVQDPGNVGTLIRTAAAFGFTGVILSEKCADPFSPKCVQAAAGSTLSVWIRNTSGYLRLADELRGQGYPLATADLRGEAEPAALRGSKRLVLALGNEAAGPTRALIEMSDSRFKIPIRRDHADSLNVAACGAIAMFLAASRA